MKSVNSASARLRQVWVRGSAVALGGRVWLDGLGLRNSYDPGDKNYATWRILVVDPDKLDPSSRGIPPEKARALLTRAFLSDALEGLDDAATAALDAEITALLEGAS